MLIDLTQTFIDKMMVYPGDEAPSLTQTHFYEKDHYNSFVIEAGLHNGTHIDGPMHMTESELLLCDVDLDSFIGKACIINASDCALLKWDEKYREVISGKSIVLFYTGYSVYFGTEKYLSGYPVIDPSFAEKLVELKVKLIGVDTFSPDYQPYDVHKILLGNGILIAENLANLDKLLQADEFEVIALPIKIKSDGAFARVIARIN